MIISAWLLLYCNSYESSKDVFRFTWDCKASQKCHFFHDWMLFYLFLLCVPCLSVQIVKERFGMVAPDVQIEDGKGTILISSEEGETEGKEEGGGGM